MDVWILFENEFIRGKVFEEEQLQDHDSEFVHVYVEAFNGVTIPIPKSDVYVANPLNEETIHTITDLTSLRYLHEPGIIRVLRGRAYQDKPYTFLSGILVSVNPLVEVEEEVEAGCTKPGAALTPHPFSLAERSFQQLCFAAKNEAPCAQSIVIAGESGAGKTEVSKRVLRHLIGRVSHGKGTQQQEQNTIDAQLLGVNPILESFGNATTLRNHNSSRFGKLTKLHFDCSDRENIRLVYASISSYLLERSRISFHSQGERSFRVFYELVVGADEELKAIACLDGDRVRFPDFGFRYLTPVVDTNGADGLASPPEEDNNLKMEGENDDDTVSEASGTTSSYRERQNTLDKRNFKALVESFKTVGLGDQTNRILCTLAGVLHLGNVSFKEVDTEEGSVAMIDNSDDDVSIHIASRLLGLESATMTELLCERVVKMPTGEVVNVKRKLSEAVEARDALAKSLYSALFDWLLMKINSQFAPQSSPKYAQTYVGVLDIFGFETFTRNDFEQLLINFANEALQETFHEKVLVAEAQLYQEEGIMQDEQEATLAARGSQRDLIATEQPDVSESCLTLLMGHKGIGFRGILQVLQAESECPKPTDEKFLHALHSQFNKHTKFPSPHPKDKRTTFIVSHYASNVTYTIGNFTHKNLDRLPKDAQAVLAGSSDDFIQQLLQTEKQQSKRQQRSIASKFSQQIYTLIQDLDSTQCSFVRCIKPNLAMSRDHNGGQWFDRAYVLDQLRCLGIPQTAKALRGGGYPTRLDYSQVVQTCPAHLIDACKHLLNVGNRGNDQHIRDARLTRALFWAYQVPEKSFRCGRKKVFFTTGALEQLDKILERSTTSDDVERRIRHHCATSAWRSCVVKVIVTNKFQKLLQQVRTLAKEKRGKIEARAATKIQTRVRLVIAKVRYMYTQSAIVQIQAFIRMILLRKDFVDHMHMLKKRRERKALQKEVHDQLQAQIKLCSEQMELLKKQVFNKERKEKEWVRHQQQMRLSRPITPELPTKAEMNKTRDIEIPKREQHQEMKSTPAPPLAVVMSNVDMQMPSPSVAPFAPAGPPPPVPPKPEHKRVSASSNGTNSNSNSMKNLLLANEQLLEEKKDEEPKLPPQLPRKSQKTLQRQSMRITSLPAGFTAQPRIGEGGKLLRPKKSWRKCLVTDYKQSRTIFLRLRQEERSYVDALSIINGNYFQPLVARLNLDDHSKILGKREVDIIFSNLTQLLHLHAQMLGNIESQLARQKAHPETHDITMEFLCAFKATLPFLRTIYAVYVKQHSNSLAVLTQCKAEAQKFSKFLKNTAENKQLPSYGTDLRDLLRIPMGQISRYNDFLHTLLSHTNPDSEAHNQLRETCRIIEQVAKEVDEEREVARRDIRAYEIATQMEVSRGWRYRGNEWFHPNKHSSIVEALTTSNANNGTVVGHRGSMPSKRSSDMTTSHFTYDPAAGSSSSSSSSEHESHGSDHSIQQHILCPGRSFLCEWVAPLTVAIRKDRGPDRVGSDPRVSEAKPRDRAFFLFSDVLMVAKRNNSQKYELRMWMDLSKIWVDSSHMKEGRSPNHGSGNRSSTPSYMNETFTKSGERAYPLQVVYISMSQGQNNALTSSSHTSVALRMLQNASRRSLRRSGLPKPEVPVPKVENLIMWFSSPSQRKEVYNQLTEASQRLKSRREQFAKMQKMLGPNQHPVIVKDNDETIRPIPLASSPQPSKSKMVGSSTIVA